MKSLFKKSIILILVMMTLLNSILPTFSLASLNVSLHDLDIYYFDTENKNWLGMGKWVQCENIYDYFDYTNNQLTVKKAGNYVFLTPEGVDANVGLGEGDKGLATWADLGFSRYTDEDNLDDRPTYYRLTENDTFGYTTSISLDIFKRGSSGNFSNFSNYTFDGKNLTINEEGEYIVARTNGTNANISKDNGYQGGETWSNLNYSQYTDEDAIGDMPIIYHFEAGESCTVDYGEGQSASEKKQGDASKIEQLITMFFITLGDGAMWAISAVVGRNITLDSLFFNTYKSIDINIFGNNNDLIGASGVKNGIDFVYSMFMTIAAATFLASLLYIGLKILLVSTGKDKARFKEYIVAWVKGVAILFLFPIVMKLMIEVNAAFVVDIANMGGGSVPSYRTRCTI